MHAYLIIFVLWGTLGISSSLAAPVSVGRIVFITVSWFLLEWGWQYLQKYANTQNNPNNMGFSLTSRIVYYSKTIFRIWLMMLTQHVLWWDGGHINLEEHHVLYGYIQSTIILFCVIWSFWVDLVNTSNRKEYLKWFSLGIAFLLPPWREPWYIEPVAAQQARWIIMGILFSIQSYEIMHLTIKKNIVADLYVIRVGWVALVNPIFMVFTLVCFAYYAITLLKISVKEPYVPRFPDMQQKSTTQQPIQHQHQQEYVPYEATYEYWGTEDQEETIDFIGLLHGKN